MENEHISKIIETPISLKSDPFALIDRMQWSKEYEAGMFDRLYPIPLVPEGMEADEEKFPLLVNMATVDDDIKDQWSKSLNESLQLQTPTPLAMLLQIDRSQYSTEELKAHLIQQLIQRNRQINQKYLLRYYDPRVLVHISRLMRPQQMRYFLGPVFRWEYYLRDTWHSIVIPNIESAPLLILNSEQWEQLAHVSEINRVINYLSDEHRQTSFDILAQKIEKLINKAKTVYQLANAEDRVAFAIHGMNINYHFDDHQLIQSIFTKLKMDTETSYQEEIQSLTASDWQTIKLSKKEYPNNSYEPSHLS